MNVQRIIYGVSGTLLVGAIVSYFAVPGFGAGVDEAYAVLTSGDRPRVAAYVEGYGWWGPLLLIALMTVQLFLIVVPSWLLMIVGVLAYGPWWGAALGVVAVAVASTVGYWVGRGLGGGVVHRLVGDSAAEKLDDTLEEHGAAGVFVSRVAPFLSNDAISFVAGAFGMGYFRFMAATLAGIVPLVALIAYFIEDIGSLKQGLAWGTGVLVVGYVGYVLWKRNKGD